MRGQPSHPFLSLFSETEEKIVISQSYIETAAFQFILFISAYYADWKKKISPLITQNHSKICAHLGIYRKVVILGPIDNYIEKGLKVIAIYIFCTKSQ